MRANAATVQAPASPPTVEPLELTAPRPATTRPLTVACPAVVVSSTPFECTLTIAPFEPLLASGAELRVTVPPGLFHLANSANARFDADRRQLVVPLAHTTDGSRTVSLSLMADEAGAGRTRTLSASATPAAPGETIETPRESARFDASAAVVVAPGEPVILSPLESPTTPLTATALIVAAIVATLWTIRLRRRTQRGRAQRASGMSATHMSQASPRSNEAIGLSAIGAIVSLFLLFFCLPACIETVRARTVFVSTTCTIVDRGSAGLAPEISYVPMAIVRYDAAGRTRVASGFDVRGTMYGSNDPDVSRQFTPGGRYPCWYDPTQPQRVILRQGPSAMVWFALLPMAVLILSLSALLGTWRD